VLPPGQTIWFPEPGAAEIAAARDAMEKLLAKLPPGHAAWFPADAAPERAALDWTKKRLADTGNAKIDATAVSILPNDEPPIAPNNIPSQADISPSIPPDSAVPLVPNIAAINLHLYTLFAPIFVAGYPDAKIEIAYADPKTGNAVNKAEIFSAFDLEKAALFAFRKNTAGYNVYAGPALRVGAHKSGRAKGEDVITARYAWCEYDGKGDAERVYALCQSNLLSPAIIVTTGTIPDQRNHLYFEIDGVATPADLTAMGASLKELFGTDAVHNADRVMRLAGTVNWPSPKKMGPEYGYVPELTTLRLVPESPRYSIGTLTGLGVTDGDGAGRDHAKSADSPDKPRRGDDEILALLEATRRPGNWHNHMRDAVASMLGRGWTDLQIKLGCAPYCTGGAEDPELATLIKGGRDKWDKPDGDDEEIDAKPHDTKEGDERVANQAPVASELPTIRVGPRISKMTTHTQKMLIGARVPFYQRGGELVRPIVRTVKAAHGRLTKTAQLKSISAIFMRDTMCRHSHWERMDKRSGEFVKTTAPMSVATTLLERDGIWESPRSLA
jgi:hypothetical protein